MNPVKKFVRRLNNLRFDQIAKLTRDLELTRAAAAEQVQQAQREVELTRAAAAEQVRQAQREVELTGAAAAQQAAAAAEQVRQAQREVELTRAAAAEHARQAQNELELTRAVARDNVALQIKRQLRQEEVEMRIALHQLERELESARAESWQLHQRVAECLEQKRLEMKRTEASETDHR